MVEDDAAPVDGTDVVERRQPHAQPAQARQDVRELKISCCAFPDRVVPCDNMYLYALSGEGLGETERRIRASLVSDDHAMAE